MKTLGCNPVITVDCNNMGLARPGTPLQPPGGRAHGDESAISLAGGTSRRSLRTDRRFVFGVGDHSPLGSRIDILQSSAFCAHLAINIVKSRFQEKVAKTSYRHITWCTLVSAFPVWLVATIFSTSSPS